MMHFIPLLLVCILSLPAFQATELTKCEVSHAIKDIDGYQGISLLECEFILLPCFLPFPLLLLLCLLVVSKLFLFCLDLLYSITSPDLPVSHCLAFLTSPRYSGLHHFWRLVGKPPSPPHALAWKPVSQLWCSETSLRKFFLLSPSGACVLFHTSGYDTEAVVKDNDSTEYGLFQISDRFWCKSREFPQSENICGISCDSEYPLSPRSSVSLQPASEFSEAASLLVPSMSQVCWVPL